MSDKMTMDEGLKKISALKGNLKKVTDRLQGAVTWTEKTKSEWNFSDLLLKRDELTKELVQLEAKLAKANANRHVKVPSVCVDLIGSPEITMAEAIRWESELKGQIKQVSALFLRSDLEEQQRYNAQTSEYEVMKSIQHYSALTEVQKDEMVTKLEEMRFALDRAIDRINNSQYL